jgi:prepilin-type N-terminal cleavage/methylation domain-containing protein
MKRESGFSLVELLTAMVILLAVVAAAMGALVQAQRVTAGVALEANMQEDLRAGMHFMIQDLSQAGEGIPQGGIAIHNSSTGPAPIIRPGTGGASFSNTYLSLPALTPGYQAGQAATGVNPLTNAVISAGAVSSDVITLLYADNTLVDSSSTTSTIALNTSPVLSCAGAAISASGSSVTLATSCFQMPGGPVPISVGNLIMFSSPQGTALQYVTGVTGQTIDFANGDPASLNGLSPATYPNGTVAGLVAGNASQITITRVWMVTYYIDSTTNALRPQLVRQVNYPNYPTAATASNPAQPIGESLNQLQFTYDIINSNAPAGTYPNGPGDAPTPASWTSPTVGADTPQQIRAVNIFLAGRSEYAYNGAASPQYFYNNLTTQVSIRNLAFVNQFNTTP